MSQILPSKWKATAFAFTICTVSNSRWNVTHPHTNTRRERKRKSEQNHKDRCMQQLGICQTRCTFSPQVHSNHFCGPLSFSEQANQTFLVWAAFASLELIVVFVDICDVCLQSNSRKKKNIFICIKWKICARTVPKIIIRSSLNNSPGRIYFHFAKFDLRHSF